MTPLARARAALGTPFRLHGRDLAGLDCVGLVAFAWRLPAPTGYPLRASPRARIERELAALGFTRSDATPGAIVLVASGPGQLHLGISTGAGLIHADAVARRVVERSPAPWPILATWHLEEE